MKKSKILFSFFMTAFLLLVVGVNQTNAYVRCDECEDCSGTYYVCDEDYMEATQDQDANCAPGSVVTWILIGPCN